MNPEGAKPRHPRLLRVGLLVLSLGFTLCTAEVLLRLEDRRVVPEPALPAELPSALPELAFDDLDRPNMRGVYNGVVFRTNRDGARGPDYARPKPPGVFRIAAIGDSITMGSGVAESDTYAARLQSRLDASSDGRRYQVINLGRAGANLDWSVKRLRDPGLSYEPDLVVYGYTMNDIEGPSYRHFVRPGFGMKRRRREGGSRLLARLRSLRDLVNPVYGSYMYELDHNYFANPEAWGFFVGGLDELAEIGRQRGVCVHMLIHTRLKYLHFLHPLRRYYDAVEEAALARGLSATPTLQRFVGESAAEMRVGPKDAHPNARAHALLADELERGLRALPERCWKVQSP